MALVGTITCPGAMVPSSTPAPPTAMVSSRKAAASAAHMTRSSNRYRQYNASAIERLELVQQAQRLGLTLGEIAEFIQAWEDDVLSKGEIRAFFREKIAQVDERMEELRRVRAYLYEKLENLE